MVSPKSIHSRICCHDFKFSIRDSPSHIHLRQLHSRAAFWQYPCSLYYRPVPGHFPDLFLKAGGQHPGGRSENESLLINLNKNSITPTDTNHNSIYSQMKFGVHTEIIETSTHGCCYYKTDRLPSSLWLSQFWPSFHSGVEYSSFKKPSIGLAGFLLVLCLAGWIFNSHCFI